jgi:hypothetical protein
MENDRGFIHYPADYMERMTQYGLEPDSGIGVFRCRNRTGWDIYIGKKGLIIHLQEETE